MAAVPALRLAVAQFGPLLRDPEHNATVIAAAGHAAGADILLTPELSLTGYSLGDAVHALALPAAPGMRLPRGPLDAVPGHVVAGLPEQATGGPFNTAAVLRAGTVVFRHRKLYLPTYGMFDEARWFGRGAAIRTWTMPQGWTVGLLVCEDFWHPGLAYALASAGTELLLVQAAAPGRGVWDGGSRGAFASADSWERIARTTAQLYGMYVALANRTGVEGGVTFCGGSLIVGPDGDVIAAAGDDGEQTLTATLTRAELARCRVPYSHIRDDDPRIVADALRRLEAT